MVMRYRFLEDRFQELWTKDILLPGQEVPFRASKEDKCPEYLLWKYHQINWEGSVPEIGSAPQRSIIAKTSDFVSIQRFHNEDSKYQVSFRQDLLRESFLSEIKGSALLSCDQLSSRWARGGCFLGESKEVPPQ